MNTPGNFLQSLGAGPVPVIAEVGFNHEGDLAEAKAMIRAAAEAGAAAVKFQTFQAADLALPSSPHYALIQSGELTLAQHQELAAEAKASGLPFLSTPFSEAAVDLLEKVGVTAYKVASMDLTNPLLLRRVARTRKPVVLSTGMATLAEIASAVELLRAEGAPETILLHCLSLYPAGAADLNLEAIGFLRRTFGLATGYSDHYTGTRGCLAAAMLGAEVIETHFTLDCARPGGDHGHSVDPSALRGLINDIRLFQTMRGPDGQDGQNGQKFFATRPDRAHAPIFRRGLHAAHDLDQGHELTRADLLTCRPAGELGPADLELILGRRLRTTVKGHEPLLRRNV